MAGRRLVGALLSILCRRTDCSPALAGALQHEHELDQRPGCSELTPALGHEWFVCAAGGADFCGRNPDGSIVSREVELPARSAAVPDFGPGGPGGGAGA